MKYIEQITQDLKTARAARALNQNIIYAYLGMPGIGKTQMVKQAADALGLAFFGDLVLSSCSPMDIMGKVPNPETHTLSTYPSSDIPLQAKVGDTAGVWFIDECTNATSDTFKALQQGIVSRSFGGQALGANVIIVLAGNRQTDKAGSASLSSAIYNRVTWRDLEWTKDNSDDALNYIAARHLSNPDSQSSLDLAAILLGYFAFKPMTTADFTDALSRIGREAYTQWCSPRSLEQLVVRSLCEGRLPSITDAAGDIGLGRATELCTHASLLGQVPTYEAVIASPDTAKLPASVEVLYAAVGMLAVRLDKAAADFGAVWAYLSRIPANDMTIKVTALRLILKQCPAAAATAAFQGMMKGEPDMVKAVVNN